jgi:hypothetical protein
MSAVRGDGGDCRVKKKKGSEIFKIISIKSVLSSRKSPAAPQPSKKK